MPALPAPAVPLSGISIQRCTPFTQRCTVGNQSVFPGVFGMPSRSSKVSYQASASLPPLQVTSSTPVVTVLPSKSLTGCGSVPRLIVIFQPGFGRGFAAVIPAGSRIVTERVGEPSQPWPMMKPITLVWPAGAVPGVVPTWAEATPMTTRAATPRLR